MAQRPRHRRPSAGLGRPADYSNYLGGQMPKLSFPRGTHGSSSPKKVELVMARWHRGHVIDAPSAGLGQPADYSNYLRGQMPKLSFPRGTHDNSSLKKAELVMARWHKDHVIDAPSAGLGQPADHSNYLRGQMPTLSKVLLKLPHVSRHAPMCCHKYATMHLKFFFFLLLT